MNKCDKEELIRMLTVELDISLQHPEFWKNVMINNSNVQICSSKYLLTLEHKEYPYRISCHTMDKNTCIFSETNDSYIEKYANFIKNYSVCYYIAEIKYKRYVCEYERSVINDDKEKIEYDNFEFDYISHLLCQYLSEEFKEEVECARLSKLLNLSVEETQFEKLVKIYEKELEPKRIKNCEQLFRLYEQHKKERSINDKKSRNSLIQTLKNWFLP